jgi:hypothetical protein
MLGHRGFPLGQLLVAAIQQAADVKKGKEPVRCLR